MQENILNIRLEERPITDNW